MRTVVYIDGYNLYYGALKGTPYKWLDVVKLFTGICHIQDPGTAISSVKFFTAPIKARVATRGELSFISQNTYHRALINHGSTLVEIIKGYHTLELGKPPKYQTPIVKNERVDVWELEEKQTDVNIALHMYRDATSGNYDQVVLVTNDSDLIPALEFIRLDKPDIQIGVIIPRKESGGGSDKRPPNKGLSDIANWTRGHILSEELAAAQLPKNVPTKKKPASKPDYW